MASCIGPKLTVCIIDKPGVGLQCHDQRTNKDFTVPPEGSENYVAMPPADFAKLLDFVKNGCKK